MGLDRKIGRGAETTLIFPIVKRLDMVCLSLLALMFLQK